MSNIRHASLPASPGCAVRASRALDAAIAPSSDNGSRVPGRTDIARRLARRSWPALVAAIVSGWWWFGFRGRGDGPALDVILYFYPMYEAAYRRVAMGELPLWNSHQLCGISWIGPLQVGLFYPAHVLYMLLAPPRALAVSQGLHMAFIGVTTAAFARSLGLGRAAALVAALLFTVRGRVPFALFSPNYFEAIAWLPLGCLAISDLAAGRRCRGASLLALATGMSWLAGYPQTTIYVVYTWASLVLAMLIGERSTVRQKVALGAAFAGAIALGGVVAAVQLVPGLEHALVGVRGTSGLDVQRMGAAISPAGGMLFQGAIAGSPFAYGVAALATGCAAILHRRARVAAVWAIVLAVVSAAFSLGTRTPLFALYQRLPAIGWFREPDRILAVTDFAIAVAAGIGIDAIAAAVGAGRRAPLVLTAAGLAAVVVAARGGRAPAAELPLVLGMAVAVVAVMAGGGGAARLLGRRCAGSLVAWACAALVAFELARNPWHHEVVPYDLDMDATYGAFAESFRTLARRADHDRVWIYGNGPYPTIAHKMATRFGFRVIGDCEPVNLRRQSDYFTYFADGSVVPQRFPFVFMGDLSTLVPPPAARRRLLDLAATRYVVMLPPQALRPVVQAFVASGGFVRGELPSFALFENTRALPRAFVTHRVRPAPEPAALLEALARPDFDPLTESYVEGDPGLPRSEVAVPRGGPARILQDDEEVVELEATLAAPGLVVLADTFAPGWRATVDGTPAGIYATNHLFRGVPAPPGTHRVRFEYRPRSVTAGAAATGCGLAGMLVLALGGGFVRRSNRVSAG